jgi:phosphate transport system substrate-binding protein
MISGPLQNEIDALRPDHPNLPFDQLQTFNIWNTRMAFAVNKNNPVRSLTTEQMRGILMGQITNWRQVGGSDLPIRVVQVRDGGGVQASIEETVLGGKSISAPNAIYVQISSQVVKIVEQLPEALGLSQVGIVRQSNTAELKLDRPVEQHLDLVTLGDPTREMRRVIEAAHHVAGMAFEQ